MSSTGFTKKRIAATISLAPDAGSFDGTASDTVTLSGLRMMADLVDSTGDSMGMLQLRVFGLPQAMMNRLTIVGDINRVILSNTIFLAAGDDERGLATVFTGTISDAWAEYNSSPDVAFNVIAYVGLGELLKPVGVNSYPGSTDVAQIMADLAKIMGLAFENNGVDARLSKPYFDGTALTQVRTCAQAAGIWYTIENGKLAIWPKNSSRVGVVHLISPATGMVGYPTLSSKGLTLKTVFNPNIRIGRDVKVESSIPMACGTFRVSTFSHSLSSELAGGPWFTTLECFRVD
jgi:hypothetical protein